MQAKVIRKQLSGEMELRKDEQAYRLRQFYEILLKADRARLRAINHTKKHSDKKGNTS